MITAVTILSILMACFVILHADATNDHPAVLSRVTSSTAVTATADIASEECSIFDLVNLLLMKAGDVEVNPGPVTSDSMLEGLARLAAAAPQGPVKNIVMAWSPDKDVKTDMDKQFKVPELRQALAWLKYCDVDNIVVKNIKRKADILDALLVALERLLPEQCDKCQAEYTVSRESSPAMQCSGCQQGFHQECLEELVGKPEMPAFPGQIYWLCSHCSPKFSLMTVVGQDGKSEKPRSKRVVKEPVSDPPPAQPTAEESQQTAEEAQQTAEENVTPDNSNPRESIPPAAPLPDCPFLVRNGCPHGMSGKKNGVCKYLHKPRCNTYMKWGDKVDKGCKKVPCDKLHPLVCPRSLDLKCLEKSCDVKLHTRKCQRSKHSGVKGDQPSAGSRDTTSGQGRRPTVSKPKPTNNDKGQDSSDVQHNPGYSQAAYQGWAGPTQGLPQQWGVQGQQQQGYSHRVQQGCGLQGNNCYNNIFQACTSEQPLRNTALHDQYGQANVHQGFLGCVQGQQHQQGGAAPGQPHQQSGAALGQHAGAGQSASPGVPVWKQSFQMGCTTPDPAVHQILEVWAGNMQKELERQSEISRNMLANKVKEVCQFLGGQGVLRPSC